MLTAIIVLSVFSGAALVGLLVQWARLNKRKARLERKDAELRRLRASNKDPHPFYYAKLANNDMWKVMRMTYTDGQSVETLIKVFDTDDAAYNHNEALEHVEILNEKPCYK